MSWKILFSAAIVVSGILLSAADAVNEDQYRQKDGIFYLASDVAADGYRQARCKLDLYYPEGKPGFATVIWFHGGGLTDGEKSIPAMLKERGVAVAGVNYRLVPKPTTPKDAPNREVCVDDCIQDAAAAVGWIYRNIDQYGGDPEKIYLTGHSAGGYLALMVGMAPKYLAPYGMKPSDLAGLIPFSGHTITHFTERAARGIGLTQPVVDELAPLYYVTTPELPPILLITGDREMEMAGRYEENAYLMRMLKLNGHPVTLYELQGYGHDMVYPGMPILVEFLKKHNATK